MDGSHSDRTPTWHRSLLSFHSDELKAEEKYIYWINHCNLHVALKHLNQNCNNFISGTSNFIQISFKILV